MLGTRGRVFWGLGDRCFGDSGTGVLGTRGRVFWGHGDRCFGDTGTGVLGLCVWVFAVGCEFEAGRKTDGGERFDARVRFRLDRTETTYWLSSWTGHALCFV